VYLLLLRMRLVDFASLERLELGLPKQRASEPPSAAFAAWELVVDQAALAALVPGLAKGVVEPIHRVSPYQTVD
jgi:hypothetical protein